MLQEISYEEILAIRQEVMYPDKDIEYVKLADDHLGLHLAYYDKGKPVSVVSLFLKGKDLQFRKLATLKEHQGKGYASFIIKWILNYAKDVKLEKVWCNARKDKTSFYKEFGFQENGETFSRDGHDYVIVEKTSF